jgi:MFS transporter, DHA1 family, multidrug resistance protein
MANVPLARQERENDLISPPRRRFLTTGSTAGNPFPSDEERVLLVDRRAYPIALSSFLVGTSISMILPLMPVFCSEIGISSSGYGIIVGAMGLSRLIANLPAGWLADKVGRRPLLIGGPLITAVGMLGMGLSTTFSAFLSFRIFSGVGGAFDMTAGQLYLSDISHPANRARVFAPAVMAFSAGSVVGPAIGGYLAGAYSMQLPFLIVSGGLVSVALSNYFLLPETIKKQSTTLQAKQGLWEEIQGMTRQWKPLWQQKDIRSVLGLHGAYWFVSSCCIYTTLPLLGSGTFGLSMAEIATWYVLMAIVNIAGARTSATLSDKYGRKATLVPSTVFMAASLMLMPFAGSYAQITGLVFGWGIGGALFGANTTTYISDRTTEATRSQALTLLRTCADGGLMLGGTCSGLMTLLSPEAPFVVSSILIALAGAHFARRAFRRGHSPPPPNET